MAALPLFAGLFLCASSVLRSEALRELLFLIAFNTGKESSMTDEKKLDWKIDAVQRADAKGKKELQTVALLSIAESLARIAAVLEREERQSGNPQTAVNGLTPSDSI